MLIIKKGAVDITTEDKITIQMHNIMTKMLQNRSFEIFVALQQNDSWAPLYLIYGTKDSFQRV